MSRLPWFKLFTGDLLRDTAMLSLAAMGAHINLLCVVWESGSLPDNDAVLARVARATPDGWRQIRPELEPLWPIYDGYWHRPDHLEEQRVALAAQREGSRKGGRKSAAKRQGRREPTFEPTPEGEPEGTLEGSPEGALEGTRQVYQKAEGRRQNQKKEEEIDGMSPPCGDAPSSVVEFPGPADLAWSFEEFNRLAESIGLPVAKTLTDRRRQALRNRLLEVGREGWTEALNKLRQSRFCRGQNANSWRVTLDFMLQPSSLQKLLEGNYDDKGAPSRGGFDPTPRRADGRYVVRGL